MTLPPNELDAIKREVMQAVTFDSMNNSPFNHPNTHDVLIGFERTFNYLVSTGRLLPDGCVGVPIEPTEEMLWAAYSVDDCVDEDPMKNRANMYKAMIAAAKGE